MSQHMLATCVNDLGSLMIIYTRKAKVELSVLLEVRFKVSLGLSISSGNKE